jgi:hypothetical protein
MKIVSGQYQDSTAYAKLAREFLDGSIYRNCGVKEGTLRQQFVRSVTDEDSLVLVAKDGKEMVGVMIARCDVSTWGVMTAYDAFTYANRPGVIDKFIRRYIKWAQDKGAQLISMANTAGVNERFDRLIEKCGLPKAGSTFIKVV